MLLYISLCSDPKGKGGEHMAANLTLMIAVWGGYSSFLGEL